MGSRLPIPNIRGAALNLDVSIHSKIVFENKVLILKKWLQTTQSNNRALQMKKHGLEVT